jgi:hypothetical protein
MKTNEFRWPFLVVLVAIVVLTAIAAPVNLGISAEWSNSNYRFSGGTAPWALGLSFVIGGLYFWLMYAPSARLLKPLPGILRRFIAFWIDFILAIMASAPIFGLIPSLMEWKRTAIFQWNFERAIPATSDKFVLAMTMVLMLPTFIAYYAFPLLRCRPSPGSCVVGYQITVDDGVVMTIRRAILRTLVGFFAVASAYAAPFIARDPKRGTFWLDTVFRTRAVELE